MKKMKIYSVELTEKEVKHLKWAIEYKIEGKESLLKKFESTRDDCETEKDELFIEERITDVKNLLNELRPIMEKLNQAK
jgi:hypothetical protein